MDSNFFKLLKECRESGLVGQRVYLYVGTFVRIGTEDVKVERDGFIADIDKYIDTVSLMDFENPVSKRDEFESNNSVIMLNDEEKSYFLDDFDDDSFIITSKETECSKRKVR